MATVSTSTSIFKIASGSLEKSFYTFVKSNASKSQKHTQSAPSHDEYIHIYASIYYAQAFSSSRLIKKLFASELIRCSFPSPLHRFWPRVMRLVLFLNWFLLPRKVLEFFILIFWSSVSWNNSIHKKGTQYSRCFCPNLSPYLLAVVCTARKDQHIRHFPNLFQKQIYNALLTGNMVRAPLLRSCRHI